MAEFTVEARIDPAAPGTYRVVVEATRCDAPEGTAEVVTEVCASLQQAEAARERLLAVMREALRDRGDRLKPATSADAAS